MFQFHWMVQLSAEGWANWSTALGMSERCGFARLDVSSEPDGILRLWRPLCRHTSAGAAPAPAELAMRQWSHGSKLPPCSVFCVSLGCAYQLFSVLGMPYRQLMICISKKLLWCFRDEAGFGSSAAAVLMDYDTEECLGLWWLSMQVIQFRYLVAQVFCL